MSPTLTTFLFEAANFLLLAGVLGWLFFKPVRKALADRQERLKSSQEETARKLAEAETLRADLQHQQSALQADLDRQRTRELDVARKQAEKILDDARSAARKEQELIVCQAARLAEAESDRLGGAIAAAAAAAVQRLLEQIGGPDLDAALVHSAGAQLRALAGQRLAPVKVESAHPLPDVLRDELRAALGDAAETAVFAVDGKLLAGAKIVSAQGLIDATALGLSGFAREALVRSLHAGANAAAHAGADRAEGDAHA